MSEFFKSPIVRNEARNIQLLQQKALILAAQYPFEGINASKTEKMFVETVKELLEKQQIFYARIRLSQDPETNESLNNLDEELSNVHRKFNTSNIDSLLKQILSAIEKNK